MKKRNIDFFHLNSTLTSNVFFAILVVLSILNGSRLAIFSLLIIKLLDTILGARQNKTSLALSGILLIFIIVFVSFFDLYKNRKKYNNYILYNTSNIAESIISLKLNSTQTFDNQLVFLISDNKLSKFRIIQIHGYLLPNNVIEITRTNFETKQSLAITYNLPQLHNGIIRIPINSNYIKADDSSILPIKIDATKTVTNSEEYLRSYNLKAKFFSIKQLPIRVRQVSI